jgi:hypothetical protein
LILTMSSGPVSNTMVCVEKWENLDGSKPSLGPGLKVLIGNRHVSALDGWELRGGYKKDRTRSNIWITSRLGFVY